MDQQKLRTLVFEKTGVRIDVDDPVFALVALNEAVLEEAVERHVAQIDGATRELLATAGAKRNAGGESLPARPALERVSDAERRIMLVAAGAALLGATVTLLGQALFFKPPPVPAPIVQARELTADQATAIRNGEKLARIVDKLDPKTRALIKAEMQKP
jgi:hypothetical protein